MPTDLRTAVRSYVDSLVVPPGDVSKVITPTRARGRLVPLAAALAVLAVVGAVTLLPGLLRAPAVHPGSGPASLPDRVARYSYLTATVSASPPGPAIALYQHGTGVELADNPQALVLGANADVYRRVDVAERRGGPRTQGDPAPMLLSPDGTRVAVGSYDGAADLALVDLATGGVTRRAAPAGPDLVPLAWSPDGRYLAVIEPIGANPYSVDPVEGRLALYDLAGGGVTRPAGLARVSAVAFAPTGPDLAVQDGGVLSIVDRSGARLRTLDSPGQLRLVAASWAPDGSRLALASPRDAANPRVVLLDPAGSGPGVMITGEDTPLGWTGARRILCRHADAVVEVDLDTGRKHTVTRFDTGPFQNYQIGSVQLAAGLLPGLRIRPAGGADRGPWPGWWRLTVAVAVALMAGLVVVVIRRFRHF
jgi:hypothetical protein